MAGPNKLRLTPKRPRAENIDNDASEPGSQPSEHERDSPPLPKKNRHGPRPDIYALDVSPEQAPVRASKRTATQRKSKPPIILPRRTGVPSSSMSSPNKQTLQSAQLPKRPTVVSSPAKGSEDLSETPPKRGRGRPRKAATIPTPSKDATPEVSINSGARKRGRPKKPPPQDPPQRTPSPIAAQSSPAHNGPEAQDDERESLGGIDGITEILQNPSPVKPIVERQSGLATALNRNSPPELQAPESEAEKSEEESSNETEDQDPAEIEDDNSFVSLKDLKTMVRESKLVGYSVNPKTGKRTLRKRFEMLYSAPGKRLKRRLDALMQTYESLSKDGPPAEGVLSEDDAINRTKAEVLEILDKRFEKNWLKGNNPKIQDKRLSAMLTDLYFSIFPRFFEVLYNCAKAQLYIMAAAEENETRTIKEITGIESLFTLVKLLLDLAGTAVDQSKDVQPKSPHNSTYKILQPTKALIPQLRELVESLETELYGKKRSQRAAERERTRPERKRARKEKEQAEKVKRQQQWKEVLLRQRAELDMNSRDPLSMALSGKARAKPAKQGRGDRARNSRSASQRDPFDNNHEDNVRDPATQPRGTNGHRSVSASQPVQSESHQREDKDNSLHQHEVDDDPFDFDAEANSDDPFASHPEVEADGPYERVKIIPRNNVNNPSAPKPWSIDEKNEFIDFMKVNRAPRRSDNLSDDIKGEPVDDRYQRLAEKLKRPMEEVVSFAKEFQDAMHACHTALKFMDECDDWTHEVWYEKLK